MNTKSILTVLYMILGFIVLFPGLCFFAAVVSSLTGLTSIDQAGHIASFGFKLYGIQ